MLRITHLLQQYPINPQAQIAAEMKHHGLTRLKFIYEHHADTTLATQYNCYELVRRHGLEVNIYLLDKNGHRLWGMVTPEVEKEILTWLTGEIHVNNTESWSGDWSLSADPLRPS